MDQFDCEIGFPKCIPSLWVCDGVFECENKKDESDAACDAKTCEEEEFRCSTGYPPCIQGYMVCDGIDHCSTRDDEEACGEHLWF